MWLFKRKPQVKEFKQDQKVEKNSNDGFDYSVLKQNNITRLSIDERWTKLFVTIKLSPKLDRAEKEMDELIKREAMLKKEQEDLEPQKRKCMNEIMNLTKDAFDNDNEGAKEKLKDCKKEIESINTRIKDVLEDIEKLEEELKTSNLKLLENSLAYIFSTLKASKDRAQDIQSELISMEQRQKDLREELETISIDWTQYATDLTELIGTDQVKRLEGEYGLEGLKNETIDTTADEGH